MSNGQSEGAKYKIVVLGDAATGKTSLLTRFMYDTFNEVYLATIGVDFLSKILYFEHETICLQLWDTAGQKRFYNLTPNYIRSVAVAIITFDVTQRDTFCSVEKWITQVREVEPTAKMILVGTKTDLDDLRQVSKEEAEALASRNDISYREISSKSASGVKDLFVKDVIALGLTTNQPQRSSSSVYYNSPYSELFYKIETLETDYPKDVDMQAIATLLKKGLNDSAPETFFNSQFDETNDAPDTLRAHLSNLAWRSSSALNSVLNLVILILQKVYAGVHAVGYCLGLASEQTAAYPSFLTFGRKQRAEALCDEVYHPISKTFSL